MTEQPINQKCRYCGADTVGSDVCYKCLDNPKRQEFFIKAKDYKAPKTYPSYAAFCDDPEEQTGFKPARIAQWLNENEYFKTDRKTDVLFYGDVETGKWTQNGETQLAEILSVILAEENKRIHYTNILHSLKGLTYTDIEFSKKLACLNGILDPTTLEFKPATLEEMTVFTVNTNYNPDAKCEDWIEFLKQVVSPEDALTLQEWSGYLLWPDYPFHKLLWIHGAGRNGKGVWQRTIEGILGPEMVSGVGLEELDGNHRFAVRQLYGKLFNPCSEPTTNRVLQTALLKKATGQDTISAECKGKDKRIDFRNLAKITVIANKFPKVRDSTLAFSERRLFISFPNEFIGKKAIPNLEKVWLDDSEKKSGILNWMLQGLQRLITQGYFTQSKSQLETEIAFERASDTIQAFLTEMAIFDKNLVTTRADAYNAYKEYCEFYGLDNESDKKFTQHLKETPKISVTTVSKPSRLRAWKGLGLRTLNEEENTSLVSDVSVLDSFYPQTNCELLKNKKSINISKNDTSDTRVCGKCELFHKPSCVYLGANFDRVLENCNFALGCRSFTPKKEAS
jgi:phage/plasmid primase, P4 family, C-terminal domain